MQTIKDAAAEFLAHKRIAVTGMSRSSKGHGQLSPPTSRTASSC
jgi:hypothetical protein